MRLIDADEVVRLIQARYECPEICKREIDAIPTIDPVKHGKWEDENPIEPNPMFRAKVCSACGRTEGSPNDFCPYCGARMDGEV